MHACSTRQSQDSWTDIEVLLYPCRALPRLTGSGWLSCWASLKTKIALKIDMKQRYVGSHLGRIAEALLLERKVFAVLHKANQIDNNTPVWDNPKHCNFLLNSELCAHLLLTNIPVCFQQLHHDTVCFEMSCGILAKILLDLAFVKSLRRCCHMSQNTQFLCLTSHLQSMSL